MNISLIINIITLVLSILWTVKSGYDYEPIIVTLGMIVALFFTSKSSKNQSKITGSGNSVFQSSNRKDGDNENESDINGDDNKVSQR